MNFHLTLRCTSYYEGTELKANHNDLGARELFSALY